jgi:hypothetical protein
MARSIECATKDQVEEWVKWSLTLTHPNDPFDPSDGGQNWNRNQPEGVIFLAALAATEPPPDQPSNRDDSTAGDGGLVYHQDNGSTGPRYPRVRTRTITIGNNDTRDILIPVLTEAACKVKYKKVRDLNKLAKKINDKEKDGEILSFSIEFDNLDDSLPPEKYNGNDLKNCLKKGTIRDVSIPPGNVFHQPAETGDVEYDCYCAILKRTALGSRNSLKFSGGKAYSYEVEYMINVR